MVICPDLHSMNHSIMSWSSFLILGLYQAVNIHVPSRIGIHAAAKVRSRSRSVLLFGTKLGTIASAGEYGWDIFGKFGIEGLLFSSWNIRSMCKEGHPVTQVSASRCHWSIWSLALHIIIVASRMEVRFRRTATTADASSHVTTPPSGTLAF